MPLVALTLKDPNVGANAPVRPCQPLPVLKAQGLQSCREGGMEARRRESQEVDGRLPMSR